eukprot:3580878-Amphidinium_carterae.1
MTPTPELAATMCAQAPATPATAAPGDIIEVEDEGQDCTQRGKAEDQPMEVAETTEVANDEDDELRLWGIARAVPLLLM